nr:MAG TPA: hypothetical protein [Caudoviricetes sp.]
MLALTNSKLCRRNRAKPLVQLSESTPVPCGAKSR